jgi:exonuclease III
MQMDAASQAALDSEGRCVCTDHGAFVLFNVYVPALSCEEKAEVSGISFAWEICRERRREEVADKCIASTGKLTHCF